MAAKLVQAINELGNSMGVTTRPAATCSDGWAPVLAAQNGNVVCDLNLSCAETRGHFQSIVDPRNQASIDKINGLARELKDPEDPVAERDAQSAQGLLRQA